ncbi:VOC family protein [Arthrobacter sp. MYb213]|uniref:VOC family protein n=1 Tax=Arthrobacter sp. MYb213 TaxID=1848595 RepID=UPI000CFCA8D4|nr:VOC family protein [Arthrobacter sp. MYb213]PRB72563.1 glyoxalase [Arthrobacter sp. MYb213]
MLHHLELWVADLSASIGSLGWLFLRLGFEVDSTWPSGISYRHNDFYIVLESGPDVSESVHQRKAPGMNHLAFHAGTRQQLDELTIEAQEHGFTLLFAEQHPFAGGAAHYATYLEDAAGFEVELVATLG